MKSVIVNRKANQTMNELNLIDHEHQTDIENSMSKMHELKLDFIYKNMRFKDNKFIKVTEPVNILASFLSGKKSDSPLKKPKGNSDTNPFAMLFKKKSESTIKKSPSEFRVNTQQSDASNFSVKQVAFEAKKEISTDNYNKSDSQSMANPEMSTELEKALNQVNDSKLLLNNMEKESKDIQKDYAYTIGELKKIYFARTEEEKQLFKYIDNGQIYKIKIAVGKHPEYMLLRNRAGHTFLHHLLFKRDYAGL